MINISYIPRLQDSPPQRKCTFHWEFLEDHKPQFCRVRLDDFSCFFAHEGAQDRFDDTTYINMVFTISYHIIYIISYHIYHIYTLSYTFILDQVPIFCSKKLVLKFGTSNLVGAAPAKLTYIDEGWVASQGKW